MQPHETIGNTILDTTTYVLQVLCLSPTRELAVQIQKVVLALGDYMNVQCHSCIGGTNLGEDIRKLDYGQHVVSGTPGRVFDMIRRRTLRTRGIKMLVLDEADEMLNKGFKEQIYDVYRYLLHTTKSFIYICFCNNNLLGQMQISQLNVNGILHTG